MSEQVLADLQSLRRSSRLRAEQLGLQVDVIDGRARAVVETKRTHKTQRTGAAALLSTCDHSLAMPTLSTALVREPRGNLGELVNPSEKLAELRDCVVRLREDAVKGLGDMQKGLQELGAHTSRSLQSQLMLQAVQRNLKQVETRNRRLRVELERYRGGNVRVLVRVRPILDHELSALASAQKAQVPTLVPLPHHINSHPHCSPHL